MLEKIATVLKEYKGDDNLVITEETTFESLGLDSLDMMELIMNLEDACQVTIELDKGVKTVGDLIKTIS